MLNNKREGPFAFFTAMPSIHAKTVATMHVYTLYNYVLTPKNLFESQLVVVLMALLNYSIDSAKRSMKQSKFIRCHFDYI